MYRTFIRNCLIILLFTLTGCDKTQIKYGTGGENACTFVKEQVPDLCEFFKDVEVIEEDSLLSDLALGNLVLSMQLNAFVKKEINKERFSEIIDSLSEVSTDVEYSWISHSVNDSLRLLPKYDGMWRKVYTVKITMKSGTVKEIRVLMDSDGKTPRMMESDMAKAIIEHEEQILEAKDYILMY